MPKVLPSEQISVLGISEVRGGGAAYLDAVGL